jgi:pimeloyl-ACP methyl ester carboxylesterase
MQRMGGGHRNPIGVLLGLTIALTGAAPGLGNAQEVRMVDVDGRMVRVQTAGLEQASPTNPIVVFEAGFMVDGLSAWTSILSDVAGFAPVVAYDRAGVGGSEPDGIDPTAGHVARNLHRLLAALGAEPPYVLVGHSLGGPFIRMFAHLFPDEVAGLVFIDPTPTTSEEERRERERAMGLSEASRSAIADISREQLARMPSASIRAETEMIIDSRLNHWPEFQELNPMPNVPVAILMAGRYEPRLDDGIERDCEPRQCHAQVLRVTREWQARQISGVSRAWLTVAMDAGHFIQNDDPELTVWTIRRIWSSEPARTELRLDQDLLDQYTGVYQLRADYTLTVTREHEQLFVQVTGQRALPIFAETESDFYFRVVEWLLRFERDVDGSVSAIVLTVDGSELRWERVR